MTNYREKAIFAAPLSGRQAMEQFIVINAETANKCWVWSGGSPGAPLLQFSASLAPLIALCGSLGARPLGKSLANFLLVFLTNKVSCLIFFPLSLLSGLLCFLRVKEERQIHAIITILATVILISAHESGRLHVQVHGVMGRVGL